MHMWFSYHVLSLSLLFPKLRFFTYTFTYMFHVSGFAWVNTQVKPRLTCVFTQAKLSQDMQSLAGQWQKFPQATCVLNFDKIFRLGLARDTSNSQMLKDSFAKFFVLRRQIKHSRLIGSPTRILYFKPNVGAN